MVWGGLEWCIVDHQSARTTFILLNQRRIEVKFCVERARRRLTCHERLQGYEKTHTYTYGGWVRCADDSYGLTDRSVGPVVRY